MTIEEFKKECELSENQLKLELKAVLDELKNKKERFTKIAIEQEKYGVRYEPKIKGDYKFCPNCITILKTEYIKTDYNDHNGYYYISHICTCPECKYEFASRTEENITGQKQ